MRQECPEDAFGECHIWQIDGLRANPAVHALLENIGRRVVERFSWKPAMRCRWIRKRLGSACTCMYVLHENSRQLGENSVNDVRGYLYELTFNQYPFP